MKQKPELLLPAGSFEKAKTAFLYGADAVYVGTPELSLRSRAELTFGDLKKTVELAHGLNKKVYAAINIYARDDDYELIEKQAKELGRIQVDGIIVSDGGVLDAVKDAAPGIPIHISTQANTVSSRSARFWYRNGAKRIILARELTKTEIKNLVENKPKDLETEIFVHGAVCYSYSGRCLLSNFMINRDANHGDCAQCCRWQYNVYLEEVKRPGEFLPVEEDMHGTYILSSKDLCLMERIPDLVELGVDSLKVEGRLKTEYYIATVAHAYRMALDDYYRDPENWDPSIYMKELYKTNTKGFSVLFFDGRDSRNIQEYEGNDKRVSTSFDYAGIVYDAAVKQSSGFVSVIEIKNRIQKGDRLEILVPYEARPLGFVVDELRDVDTGESIGYINPGRAGQKVLMKLPVAAEKGWILRKSAE